MPRVRLAKSKDRAHRLALAANTARPLRPGGRLPRRLQSASPKNAGRQTAAEAASRGHRSQPGPEHARALDSLRDSRRARCLRRAASWAALIVGAACWRRPPGLQPGRRPSRRRSPAYRSISSCSRLTLLGVALFHHHTLQVALTGLASITLFKVLCFAVCRRRRRRRPCRASRPRMGAAREPARPAARLRAAVEALRGEQRARVAAAASCRTTGRAASCCW